MMGICRWLTLISRLGELIHKNNFSIFKFKWFHPVKARWSPIFWHNIGCIPKKYPFVSIVSCKAVCSTVVVAVVGMTSGDQRLQPRPNEDTVNGANDAIESGAALGKESLRDLHLLRGMREREHEQFRSIAGVNETLHRGVYGDKRYTMMAE